jgi:hypothetical protein
MFSKYSEKIFIFRKRFHLFRNINIFSEHFENIKLKSQTFENNFEKFRQQNFFGEKFEYVFQKFENNLKVLRLFSNF